MIPPPADPPRSAVTPRLANEQHGPTAALHGPATDPPGRPLDTDAPDSGKAGDIVDEWGRQSFPASDPPANW
jgi:hypothetical protein